MFKNANIVTDTYILESYKRTSDLLHALKDGNVL